VEKKLNVPDIDPRVRAVIAVMRNLVADDLRISVLASNVNLSTARLRQLFKKQTGQAPSQYLKKLRLDTAAVLLETSFLSIKEVVFKSGSQDVSNFVRDFKKLYGVTPSRFRARCQRLQEQGAACRDVE
jgi:transcriptional regulator GlxA family with amidase domain